MSNKPDWAVVLRTLYDSERSRFDHDSSESDHSIHPDHALVGELSEAGLEQDSVEGALEFLRDAGMLDIDWGEDEWYLTAKGFSVAHDRVKREREAEREDTRVERQNDVNRAIGLLTMGLLLATFWDTLISLYSNEQNMIGVNIIVLLIIEAIIVILILHQLRRRGLLTLK